mmetsp:Transcript_15058/g.30507  ORF Transcript_15058/g.30507 Transcript_15058/m.30507 type:complete len:258 (-) Transcript_15058:835-1608(-)
MKLKGKGETSLKAFSRLLLVFSGTDVDRHTHAHVHEKHRDPARVQTFLFDHLSGIVRPFQLSRCVAGSAGLAHTRTESVRDRGGERCMHEINRKEQEKTAEASETRRRKEKNLRESRGAVLFVLKRADAHRERKRERGREVCKDAPFRQSAGLSPSPSVPFLFGVMSFSLVCSFREGFVVFLLVGLSFSCLLAHKEKRKAGGGRDQEGRISRHGTDCRGEYSLSSQMHHGPDMLMPSLFRPLSFPLSFIHTVILSSD